MNDTVRESRGGVHPRMTAVALFLVVVSVFLVGPAALAQPAGSASYKLVGQVLDSAGGPSTSAGYKLMSCLDHTPAGANASASYRVSSGCGWELQILAGVPNVLTATGGSSQSTGINKPFPLPLEVTVRDLYSDPVGGMTVVYTSPASGASAALSNGGSAMTGAGGIASVTATANATTGTYTVDGLLSGLPTVQFTLTNDTTPVTLQTFTAD